jgi:hypothetical protein
MTLETPTGTDNGYSSDNSLEVVAFPLVATREYLPQGAVKGGLIRLITQIAQGDPADVDQSVVVSVSVHDLPHLR